MPATKRLVLDLAADTVDAIEARVAAGEYASASALVLAELEGGDELVTLDTEDQEAFDRRCALTLERLRAGDEEVLPAEEVFGRLLARLHADAGEEDRRAAGT